MTDKQGYILADLTAAINELRDEKINALGENISRADIKRIMPAFDMLRLVVMDNSAAIERVAHVGADHVRAAYQEHVLAHVGSIYSLDDIYALQAEFKNVLKNEKIPGKQPARLLYIADTHFYHNRLCQDMDHCQQQNYWQNRRENSDIWQENAFLPIIVGFQGDPSV